MGSAECNPALKILWVENNPGRVERCWTEGEYGGMEDPFKQKLHQPNVENWLGSGQTKWVYDDFDPKYGLVRSSGLTRHRLAQAQFCFLFSDFSSCPRACAQPH